MTTMEVPLVRVRVAPLRRVLAFARGLVAAVRERRAEFARCTALATEYRATPVETRVRGVYPSHRAPRVRRAQRASRAPREARHTPAPGRWRVELPPDWRAAVRAGRAVAAHRMAWARPSVASILAGV